MLQARLERRIDHLLDITSLFLRPVDPLVKRDGAWGLRSPYRREVFEYLARRPRTPTAFARLLKQESEAGAGDLLRFLFDYRDFWAPMTDGRRTRSADVRARIPELSDAFARYLETGDPCWSRPVVVLTRQDAADRSSAGTPLGGGGPADRHKHARLPAVLCPQLPDPAPLPGDCAGGPRPLTDACGSSAHFTRARS
jgi:hypothetical protein